MPETMSACENPSTKTTSDNASTATERAESKTPELAETETLELVEAETQELAEKKPDNILRNPDFNRANSAYEFTVFDLHGERIKLDKYTGRVCLFVNIASKCKSVNVNMRDLNILYDNFYKTGLRILAFPCNQFGEGEPGSPDEIAAWFDKMAAKYDLFGKVEVNGLGADPLWKYLKFTVRHPGEDRKSLIRWNFSKFVTNKRGIPQERFEFETPFNTVMNVVKSYL